MSVHDQPGTTPAQGANRAVYKIAVLLVLIGGIAYCNSLTKSFLLDDVLWITNTDRIRHLWDYVSAMPTRPFFALSLHLNYRVHELNVFGYHVVNVSIHLAASLVLFGLVRRTLLLPFFAGRYLASAHWFAFAVALLWVVHPLQTQAVTYIIQRCESLMGLFFLLTFYCMVRGTQSPCAWPWYVASWLGCILGAGCKEVMVTAVPLLLCYDRIFLAGWMEIARRRWWYYLGIVAAIGGMQIWSSVTGLVQASSEASFGFNIPHLQAPVYWMTQAWVLLHYFKLCLVPYPQVFSYRGWTPTTEFADFWPAGLALAVIMIAVLFLSWRRNALGFLGLWFFGILSITSIVPLLDVAFEHRLYLPLAAICCVVVFGGHWLIHWLIRLPIADKVAIVGIGVVVTAMLVLTMRRNEDYQSVETMWRSVLSVYPNDHEAINNLAVGLEHAQKYDEAIEYFKRCPESAPGMATYGILLCRQDNPSEGLRRLLAATRGGDETDEGRTEWHGAKHYDLGKIYFLLGELKAAQSHLAKAIELAPSKSGPYFAMGVLLNQQDRADDAAKLFSAGLKLDEKNPRNRITTARYFLHAYPQPSAWTRKEALFFAMQAAQPTSYKDVEAMEVLVEAYAANGMLSQAEEVVRRASASLSAADRERLQAETSRIIASHQRDASKGKKSP